MFVCKFCLFQFWSETYRALYRKDKNHKTWILPLSISCELYIIEHREILSRCSNFFCLSFFSTFFLSGLQIYIHGAYTTTYSYIAVKKNLHCLPTIFYLSRNIGITPIVKRKEASFSCLMAKRNVIMRRNSSPNVDLFALEFSCT